MKTLTKATVVALLGLVAVGACAGGGDQALVSPKDPHAIISTAMPVEPAYYPVRIVWIDGKYLSSARTRQTYWVKPGVHEIGFSAIINSNRGPRVMSNPAMSAPQKMRTLKLDLKEGMAYYFGAEVPNGNPTQWRAVIVKQHKTSH